MIQASDEFFRFCSGIHQDFVEVYGPGVDDWIEGALGFVDKDRHLALAQFLREVLAGSSDAEIMALYRSTYTELAFREARDLRLFLQMVAETIERQER